MTTRHSLTMAFAALGVSVFAGCSSSVDTSSTSPTVVATSPDPTSPDVSSASSAATESDSTTSAGSTDSRFERAKEALAAGDFSTMLELLQLSGLADEIEERQVTILAPSEEAFGKLSRDEVTDLLANPTKIDDILKRHIIDEVLTFDELSTKAEVNTLSGETLVVSAENGSVTVGGAMVSAPSDESVSGEGGQELAVLGIDRVLLDSQ
jgi:uncharacterized surface protein with fasciclin (FAS1) repeats